MKIRFDILKDEIRNKWWAVISIFCHKNSCKSWLIIFHKWDALRFAMQTLYHQTYYCSWSDLNWILERITLNFSKIRLIILLLQKWQVYCFIFMRLFFKIQWFYISTFQIILYEIIQYFSMRYMSFFCEKSKSIRMQRCLINCQFSIRLCHSLQINFNFWMHKMSSR